MITKKKLLLLDEIGFIGMQQKQSKEEYRKELQQSSAALKRYKKQQKAQIDVGKQAV